MSTTLGSDSQAGLEKFLMLEGLAARITPFASQNEKVDTQRMFENFMKKFRFGNVADPKVYIDQTIMRMCLTHRMRMVQLAAQLLKEGRKTTHSSCSTSANKPSQSDKCLTISSHLDLAPMATSS